MTRRLLKRLLGEVEAALAAVAFAEEGEPDVARRLLAPGDAHPPGAERPER